MKFYLCLTKLDDKDISPSTIFYIDDSLILWDESAAQDGQNLSIMPKKYFYEMLNGEITEEMVVYIGKV